MNGEVGEVSRGAPGRAPGAFGNEHEDSRVQCVLFVIHLDEPRPGYAHYEHIHLVIDMGSDALSGIETYQVDVQLAVCL